MDMPIQEAEVLRVGCRFGFN